MADNPEQPTAAERQVWHTVKQAEIAHILARRRGTYTATDVNAPPLNDLVGLAISGGGIRSATFGLGVLEALKEFNLLAKIDYLSTVSGGGYIGAWLSANCKRSADYNQQHPETPEPSWLSPEANWKPSIEHLRRYANYLSPNLGLLSADTWSMVTVWLRNTLLVQLLIILSIAFLLLLPRSLFIGFNTWFSTHTWQWLCVLLYLLALLRISGNLLRFSRPNCWLLNVHTWPASLVLGLSCFSTAGLIAINQGVEWFFLAHTEFPLSLALASLLTLATLGSLPLAIKLANIIKRKTDTEPKSLGYQQADIIWWAIIPIMIISFSLVGGLYNQLKPGACITGASTACSFAHFKTFGDFFIHPLSFITQWPLPIIFVSLWLLSFCSIRTHTAQDWLLIIFAPLPVALVLYSLLIGLLCLLRQAITLPSAAGPWYALVWSPALMMFIFALSILMLIGMSGRQSTEAIREWWSRFGAWLGIYGCSWMLIVVIAIYGPLWSAIIYYDNAWQALGSGWLGTTLAGVLAGRSAATGGVLDKDLMTKLSEILARITPLIFIVGLLLMISWGTHVVIALNSSPPQPPYQTFTLNKLALLGYTGQPAENLDLHIDAKSEVQLDIKAAQGKTLNKQVPYNTHWQRLSEADPDVFIGMTFGCGLVALLLAWRIDINEFSFNGFYRNRLVRCYLGATRWRRIDGKRERNLHSFTGFDEHDDLHLADLLTTTTNHPALPGPFHIINCALNLGGSTDLKLHTRHSALFTLTPLFCGSAYEVKESAANNEIGYWPTSLFGGKEHQPTLGQAIAVSGAAASPNRGYHTAPAISFLMTLFNMRLGWWFPNPKTTRCQKASPRMSLDYLLRELFGSANENSNFLAISDGGHFENLGAYELLKRQCKVIIISDGECDPLLQFEGLSTLIRMCKTDLKIILKIDVRALQPDSPSDWSRNRCAVGKIIYPDKTEGTLIYIKATMNGHEDTPVMHYKATHERFPHETTGDQFYGEEQFESYRSLGFEITKQLFDPVLREVNPQNGRYTATLKTRSILDCAKQLQDTCSALLPNAGQFSRHTERLMQLWADIGAKPYLQALDRQLTQTWPTTAFEEFRAQFYFCSQLLQLMENVYLDLNLEQTWEHPDNKGWRKLFVQWTKANAMIKTWEMTNSSYGLRFRYFCNRHLNLPIPEIPNVPPA